MEVFRSNGEKLMNYAKQIKQEKEWYEQGLEIAKIKGYSSASCDLFAMSYVDSMKRIKDYEEKR